MELGRDRITVNALGPGPIATELFTKSNPEGAPQTQRILNSIAVGRMGTPEDVARAALFFLSPDNGFVTGQIGRASCRERGEISVVGVSLKKKKETKKEHEVRTTRIA